VFSQCDKKKGKKKFTSTNQLPHPLLPQILILFHSWALSSTSKKQTLRKRIETKERFEKETKLVEPSHIKKFQHKHEKR